MRQVDVYKPEEGGTVRKAERESKTRQEIEGAHLRRFGMFLRWRCHKPACDACSHLSPPARKVESLAEGWLLVGAEAEEGGGAKK